jgi:trimeric autotransporter adhesin
MKKHVLLVGFFVLTVCGGAFAQNKTLGVGVTTPNPNAALHVESPTVNQGFIMPRLTTAQRTATGFTSALDADDDGLMVYDTDEKTVFVWDGTAWKTTASGADGGPGKFVVNNVNSTEPGLWVETNSNQPLSTPIYGLNTGTGDPAGVFRINNAASTVSALYGETNGTGPAVFGNQLGLGRGGQFQIQNTANSQAALRAFTDGTGYSGFFTVNNASNQSAAIYATTNGTVGATAYQSAAILGETSTAFSAVTGRVGSGQSNGVSGLSDSSDPGSYAILGSNSGAGPAGMFMITNASNTTTAFESATFGTGGAGKFVVNNVNSVAPALWAETNSNQPLSAPIYGLNTGTGDVAGSFRINNTSNNFPAIYAESNGTGRTATFRKLGTTGSSPAVYVQSMGGHGIWADHNSTSGYAAIIQTINTGNTNAGLYAESIGNGPSIWALKSTSAVGGNAFTAENQIATGSAANFNITDPTNTDAAIYTTTGGTGAAIQAQTSTGFAAVFGIRDGSSNGNAAIFDITNASNTYPSLQANTSGSGSAANFQVMNASNGAQAVFVQTNGLGHASQYVINNASNTNVAVAAETNGLGRAGMFYISNGSNSSPALQGRTVGVGSGVSGLTTGTGSAGTFDINNSGNSNDALFAATDGTGNSMKLNHTGASGSIAVFQSGGSNVARIGKNGIGYFNGGTQASGADVAEMFEVEGEYTTYEPGDVLVISESTDRTVEKSSKSNSTKVAGVYATKPGVRLTERNIDENTDDLVPMGVIGVIPTKVCLENGPIKRGDILVTSSKQGHAMKAIPVIVNGVEIYPTGAILGKALENFDGAETGKIKVLVNVK